MDRETAGVGIEGEREGKRRRKGEKGVEREGGEQGDSGEMESQMIK